MQAYFRGISFRLAKIGVLLAFSIGVAMSSIQLYFDFVHQEQELKQLVDRIIEVASPPAARAVHTLDDDLSAEVVEGLLRYSFIYEVSILDELGNTLAGASKAQEPNATRWLTEQLTQSTLAFESRLLIPGYDHGVAGSILLSVDQDQALAAFYTRSIATMGFGAVRNTLLVFLLFVAFHRLLAKPLIRLSSELETIDAEKPGAQRLSSLPEGRDDEIAKLLNTTNNLLDSVELSLAKRRAVEFALRRSEEHIRQVIDSLPVMIGARNSDGYYVFANRALADFFGRTTEEMQHIHVGDLLEKFSMDIDDILDTDRQIIANEIPHRVTEESFGLEDGSRMHFETHVKPLDFYDERVVLVVSNNITDRKQTQAKMEHMAYHDSLTNLPNRVQLSERLDHEIRRAKRHGYFGAVLFIDLDQFKTINDSLGHPVGDEVLKQVALRLSNTVREEDLVARLSGDEFVVVLTVLDQDVVNAALKAGEVGEKIRQCISKPYQHDDMELRLTGSVGVVVYPDKTAGVDELLRYADTAMYQVKDKGRDAIEFFNEEMAEKVSRQLIMEGDLHRALEEGQFKLFFQPKVDTHTGKMIGAEALIRWHHPDKGMISPAEFIPVLEESGMIIDVGQWVLEDACRHLQSWESRGLWSPDLKLSINISPRQFRRRGFVDDVHRTLKQLPIPENSLEMEITEGIVIQGVEETIATMETLSESGISFSLDDFGTGYSSFSYLKRLPVSVLKIDQSFIRDILVDRNDKVLVETIVTMGRLLGLEIVAEGVEEEAQLNLLQAYDCHYCQGYFFSKPQPNDVFETMLGKEKD